MEQKKSDVVKAFIDLKKGVLQLEGPQEFVEKYLDPIIKNCKPFSASSPKGEESKEKEYRYFVAESLFSLSLVLITLALINRSLNVSIWIFVVPLVILGIIIFSFFLDLILPHHKIQKCLLRNIFGKNVLSLVKLLNLAVVLALFGQTLAKTGIFLLSILGVLIALSAYAVLSIGITKSIGLALPKNSEKVK